MTRIRTSPAESLFYVENSSANTHPLHASAALTWPAPSRSGRRAPRRRSSSKRQPAGREGMRGVRGQDPRVRERPATRRRGAREPREIRSPSAERSLVGRTEFRRTVRSGRAATQRLATVFACCWKIPLTDVALSPTVMTAAVGFLSATPLMPTPACARPDGKNGSAVSFCAIGFALRVFRRSRRARRRGATRERRGAAGETPAIPPGLARSRAVFSAAVHASRGSGGVRTGVLVGVQRHQVVGLRGEGAVGLLARGAAGAAHEDVLLLDQRPGQVGGALHVRLNHGSC